MLFIHYTYVIHTLYICYSYIIHMLFIHYTYVIHTLYIRYSYIIHMLFGSLPYELFLTLTYPCGRKPDSEKTHDFRQSVENSSHVRLDARYKA